MGRGQGRKPISYSDPERATSSSVSLKNRHKAKLEQMGIDNLSELVQDIIDSLDSNELADLERRKEKVLQDWSKVEIKAGQLKAEHMRLESEINSRKQLNLDLNLEKDCGAWYLKSLLQEGKIRKYVPKVPDLHVLREVLEEKGQAIFEKDSRISMSGISDQHYQDLRRFFGKRGMDLKKSGDLVIRPERFKPTIDPPSGPGPKLRLKWIDFTRDFLAGTISSDSLLEDFKEYDPKIVSESLKNEVKKSMTPFYTNPEIKKIHKKDLKKNAEKQWGEK